MLAKKRHSRNRPALDFNGIQLVEFYDILEADVFQDQL